VDDRALQAVNRAWWDERVAACLTGQFYDIDGFLAGRSTADPAGIAAEFAEANVYNAVEVLGRRTFDVVYTSIGSIIWLPDIARWACTVAALLAPGGRFYMAEFHPFSAVLGEEDLTVTDSYFDGGPILSDEPGSYAAAGAKTVNDRSVTWNHRLGTVNRALAQAGLSIEFLHEYPFTLRARWPFLERRADRTYHTPAGSPEVPLPYSVKAVKPAAGPR